MCRVNKAGVLLRDFFSALLCIEATKPGVQSFSTDKDTKKYNSYAES